MKKFLRYFIVMPLLVIISIYALNAIIYLTIWYFCYVRTDNLLIAKIMETPVKVNIPVKFSRLYDRHSIPGVSMYTADRMPYSLRCIPEKGEIWVTAHHGGYLINHYTASYEVTDPQVRAELIELFKRARREEDEIIQREKAKNNE